MLYSEQMQFSPTQINRLSEIAADIGQVMLASVVIPYFIDAHRPSLALSGLGLSLFFWLISLAFLKLKK